MRRFGGVVERVFRNLDGHVFFADDHLAEELDGRLDDLMTLAEQPGTALLVDPALVDSLEAMADGYQVRAGKGAKPQASTTTGTRLAKDFLGRLESRIGKGETWRLPAGNPDLALAAGSGHTRVVADAAAALPDGHLLAGRPLAHRPARRASGWRRTVQGCRLLFGRCAA